MAAPDFFLSSAGEYRLLSQPRACWTKARLRDPVRNDYMLAEIESALLGQPFGLGDRDISQLILSTRYEGCTLDPIRKWPSPVHVARIFDDPILRTLSSLRSRLNSSLGPRSSGT